MANSNNFIQWVKEKIEAFGPQPPEAAWDNIANELDIEQVWTKIDNHLEYEQNILRFEKLSYIPAAAVILLLMLPFFGPLYPIKPLEPQQKISQNKKSEVSPNNINSPSDTLKKKGEPETNQEASLPANGDSLAGKNDNNRNGFITNANRDLKETWHKDKEKDKSNFARNLPHNELENLTPFDFKALAVESNQKVDYAITTTEEVNVDSSKPLKKTLVLTNYGFKGALKNQRLVNPNTFRRVEQKRFSSTKPVYGKDLGLFASFKLGEKLEIQGETNFISEMGQKFNEYQNGKYQERKVRLKYLTLNALLKINLANKIKILSPGNSDFLAGFYSGYLHEAAQEVNRKYFNTGNQYKDYDFGIIAGYEFNLNPQSKIQFKPSFRVQYGLTNIYAGNQVIPADFRRTRTASFSFNMSIGFAPN